MATSGACRWLLLSRLAGLCLGCFQSWLPVSVQQGKPLLAHSRKFRPILFCHWLRRWQPERLEIPELPFLRDSEIQVRAGSQARASNHADGFADLHVLPRMHQYSGQVQIVGLIPVRVRNVHHVAISPFAPRKQHSSAANRLHWRAYRSAIIRSKVRPVCLQDGMESRLAEV